jgi:Inosine-uridine preferring nucleoside hydrolase
MIDRDPSRQFRSTHDPEQRRLPQLPAPGKRVRLLIDTDAGCEVDDQYAIALALLCPERFDIVGFTAQHWGSPDTIGKTVRVIEDVLDAAGMAGRYPVKPGSAAIQWYDYPEPSEGVDFIVEQAMASSPDDPLYVAAIGASTNIASAYMTEPAIAERMVLVYHTRSQWPVRGANANIVMDLKAARRIFASNIPLIMFDTGTYIRCPKEKSERVLKPYGALGAYLHNIRVSSPNPGCRSDQKGFFDLGDVALLVDESLAEYDVEVCPSLTRHTTFDFTQPQGSILRVYHCSREGCFDLLHRKLAESFGDGSASSLSTSGGPQ